MTVRELLRRIDARELIEWQAFYTLEPFGDERADLRAGVIAATMANAWRGKGQKAASPQDFVMKFGRREDVSPDMLRLAAMKANAALGGRIKHRHDNRQTQSSRNC